MVPEPVFGNGASARARHLLVVMALVFAAVLVIAWASMWQSSDKPTVLSYCSASAGGGPNRSAVQDPSCNPVLAVNY